MAKKLVDVKKFYNVKDLLMEAVFGIDGTNSVLIQHFVSTASCVLITKNSELNMFKIEAFNCKIIVSNTWFQGFTLSNHFVSLNWKFLYKNKEKKFFTESGQHFFKVETLIKKTFFFIKGDRTPIFLENTTKMSDNFLKLFVTDNSSEIEKDFCFKCAHLSVTALEFGKKFYPKNYIESLAYTEINNLENVLLLNKKWKVLHSILKSFRDFFLVSLIISIILMFFLFFF